MNPAALTTLAESPSLKVHPQETSSERASLRLSTSSAMPVEMMSSVFSLSPLSVSAQMLLISSEIGILHVICHCNIDTFQSMA